MTGSAIISYVYNRKQVLWLCSIDEKIYYQFMWETAIGFLMANRNILTRHHLNAETVYAHPIFYNWWQKVWEGFDYESGTIDQLYAMPPQSCWRYYRTEHQYCFDSSCKDQKLMLIDFQLWLLEQIKYSLINGK